MPLINITAEFVQDAAANNPMVDDIKKMFKTMRYLGSDENTFAPIFLVEAEGFEPGEYFIEIVQNVVLKDDGVDVNYKLQRVKDA